MKLILNTILTCGLLATQAGAAEVTAEINDREGNNLGAVLVTDSASGIAVATLTLLDLPAGVHGIHFHETGDCSASDFASAGGHIAGDREHGVQTADGPHPGDMPNLTVTQDGTGEVEVFLPFLDVERDMMDDDGAAFVMHSGLDDYESQPAGNAGDRIACGVFKVRSE